MFPRVLVVCLLIRGAMHLRCGNTRDFHALVWTLVVLFFLWLTGAIEMISRCQEDLVMELATPKQRRVLETMQQDTGCCRRRRRLAENDKTKEKLVEKMKMKEGDGKDDSAEGLLHEETRKAFTGKEKDT